MDRVRQVAAGRREHVLRNQVMRLSVALSLARRAMEDGDAESLKEMLSEAEEATVECREALKAPLLVAGD